MSRARDYAEDAGVVLGLFLAYKAWIAFKDATPDTRPWFGKGSPPIPEPGAPDFPGPEYPDTMPMAYAGLWTEPTMRLFAQAMFDAGIDARLVLLGIAASSDFHPDESLGGNTGLLMVQRDDLIAVGYPDGSHPFEDLPTEKQIPWIGRVLGYLISGKGGRPPTTIADLATLIHPVTNPMINLVIRAEANKRADSSRETELFKQQDALLQRVLAHPENAS
jgi:hypothetical protein